MTEQLSWGSLALAFRLEWSSEGPVRVAEITSHGRSHPVYAVRISTSGTA